MTFGPKSATRKRWALKKQLDIAKALGAEREASQQVLSVYIPNKDRFGNEFDPQPWLKEAAELLFKIGDGATVTPAHDGVTGDSEDQPLWERAVMVYPKV